MERDDAIFAARYQVRGHKQPTYREIGARHGLSAERARRIVAGRLEALRAQLPAPKPRNDSQWETEGLRDALPRPESWGGRGLHALARDLWGWPGDRAPLADDEGAVEVMHSAFAYACKAMWDHAHGGAKVDPLGHARATLRALDRYLSGDQEAG